MWLLINGSVKNSSDMGEQHLHSIKAREKGIDEIEKDTYRLTRESRWTRVTFLSLKRQT